MDKLGPVDEPTVDEIRASLRRMISDREMESGALSEPTDQAPDKLIERAVAEAMRDADAEVRAEATAAATKQGTERRAPPPAFGLPSGMPTATEPAPSVELSPRLLEQRWGAQLLSPHTDATVSAAFNQLTTSMLRSGSARTVEDLVEDMLRPMLRSWLDVNLPPLVEKLVREEIQRATRGCRGPA
jgi:cell pole-organizing protein PopZ